MDEKQRERNRVYQREYRARNPEGWHRKNKLWRDANPEKMKAYMAKYAATAKGRFTKLKLRARAGNIPLVIKMNEFVEWWDESRGSSCYYCGRDISTASGQKKLDGLSIDRKDNRQGYALDNIVISCNRCNLAKGSWFTEEEMLEIADRYFKLDSVRQEGICN